MASAVVPSKGARWWRRSRLVKPRGSRRKTHMADSRAWVRWQVSGIPATRCPEPVVTGLVMAARAAAPSAGLRLSRSTLSRRRLTAKPICRRAGRLLSRPPDLEVVGVVDGGLGAQRLPLLMVLLDRRVLVVHVQARRDVLGDDPGAEHPGSRALAAPLDLPGEDEADPVRAAQVEVVPDDLLEADPPADRGVEHLGEGGADASHIKWRFARSRARLSSVDARSDDRRSSGYADVEGSRRSRKGSTDFDAEGLEQSWPGCRIDASAFVEKVSGSRPGCP